MASPSSKRTLRCARGRGCTRIPAGSSVPSWCARKPNGRDSGTLRALDLKNLPLADAHFAFAPDATGTKVTFDAPTEIRNAIARIEIIGESSAGAVSLLDERWQTAPRRSRVRRHRRSAQPLLVPGLLHRARAGALSRKSATGHGGWRMPSPSSRRAGVACSFSPMSARLDRETLASDVVRRERRRAAAFRRLPACRGQRRPGAGAVCAGAAASWAARCPGTRPRPCAVPRDSPFFGLAVPEEIDVRAPNSRGAGRRPAGQDLGGLADGTPIVTAERRGEGLIVLFHVTADPAWSNLPLSGVFVDMLRADEACAGAPRAAADEARKSGNQRVAPRADARRFRRSRPRPPTAEPVARIRRRRRHADTRRASSDGILRLRG